MSYKSRLREFIKSTAGALDSGLRREAHKRRIGWRTMRIDLVFVGPNRETVGGTSKKGWVIERKGKIVVVVFGSIDVSAGRAGPKTEYTWLASHPPRCIPHHYRSEVAAKEFFEDEVRWKLNKGYRELRSSRQRIH